MKNKIFLIVLPIIAVLSLITVLTARALTDSIPPSTPDNLSAEAISSAQINLSWDASSDNVGVAGYEIFRNGVQIATTTITAFSNTDLSASTTYAYVVRAYDEAGNASAFSNTVSATTLATASDVTAPSIPTDLSALVMSSAQINLSWTTSTDDVAIAGYAIFRDDTEIANTQDNDNVFSDLGLSASTTYSYKIKAYDEAGNRSDFSNIVSATTLATSTDDILPTVPANLIASAVSDSQINLNWDASSDNVGVAGYEIFRDGTKIALTNATSFYNMGLSASTTYSYTIRAYDEAGNTSADSNTVYATTWASQADTSSPTVPNNLTASTISSSEINLSWDASSDNVGVLAYSIFRDGNKIADTTNTSFSDIGLSSSTNYSYKIKAYDEAGNTSAFSNTVSATTWKNTDDTTAPDAPLKLTAHVISYQHVNLEWQAPENKNDVKGYIIFVNGLQIATTKHTHYNSIGLAPGTEYNFSVRAFDSSGNISGQSNILTITTETRKNKNENYDNKNQERQEERYEYREENHNENKSNHQEHGIKNTIQTFMSHASEKAKSHFKD